MNTEVVHLYRLLGRAVLLPIPLGQKGPKLKGWQNITFEQTQTPQYQQSLADCVARGGNIGVLLGPASDNLYTIDIDDDELDGIFQSDNPVLATTLQTHGHRGRNFWFRPAPGTVVPNDQAVYPLKTKDGNPYGEFRCGGGDKGAQVVIFGIHPSGDIYRIINSRSVAEIDFSVLKWFGQIPGQRERRPLKGKSIIDFSEGQIDHTQSLLGTRWLSRRSGGFIVAPSGHGKSTLVIQTASCWSCGRVAFGIKPAKPLRILIVQSEDDDNDVTEMAQMAERLQFSPEEKELVRKNTHVEWLNDVTGPEFFIAIDDFLAQFSTDLLFINPYTAYTGGDIQDDELNNRFLRVDLTRLMNIHRCGAIPIHHTPKTSFQNTDKYSWFDWMYSMAGGATLTNWARSVLVIAPTDRPGIYRFIAAKRFEKIGWQDREYWFAHSIEDGKVLWVPASSDQIAAGRKAKNATPEDLLAVIPLVDPAHIDSIVVAASQKLKIGENKTRRFLNVLRDEGKVLVHLFPRPRTNPEVRYTRQPETK